MYLHLDQEANYIFNQAVRRAERVGALVTCEHLLLEIIQDRGNSCCSFMRDLGVDMEEIAGVLESVTSYPPEDIDYSLSHSLRLYIAADYLYRRQKTSLSLPQLLYIVAALDLGASGRILRDQKVAPEEIESTFCFGGGSETIPKAELEAIKYGVVKRSESYIRLNLPNGAGIVPGRFEIPERPEAETKRPKVSVFDMNTVSVEMVSLARCGAYAPVIGRDKELESVIEVLCRKNKRNPVLVGEAGIGKTAIVEELARRIAFGNIHGRLKDSKIYSLNHSAFHSNTKFRGELEGKLNNMIEELRNMDNSILFLDEIHMIVSNTGENSEMNVANMLKPALARGDFPCIGATTYLEYKNSIEKDPALERRFSPVRVAPPDMDSTEAILRNTAAYYAKHHKCAYPCGIFRKIIELADKYMPNRHFPDKALDIIDACGAAAGMANADRIVTEEIVADVVSRQTGVPIGVIMGGGILDMRGLYKALEGAVKGQKQAIEDVASAMVRAEFSSGEGRPICSLMFAGLKGTGKRLAARTIADFGFSTQDSFLRLDLAEYSEEKSISRLVGSPPGWEGHREGGLLSEKIRRNPRCLVVAENIDKACEPVLGLFSGILGSGGFSDGGGVSINCESSVFIFVCDAGDAYGKRIGFSGGARECSPGDRVFDAAFESKCDRVVRFSPLDEPSIREIAEIELEGLRKRLARFNKRPEISRKALEAVIGEAALAGSALDIRRKLEEAASGKAFEALKSAVLKPGL